MKDSSLNANEADTSRKRVGRSRRATFSGPSPPFQTACLCFIYISTGPSPLLHRLYASNWLFIYHGKVILRSRISTLEQFLYHARRSIDSILFFFLIITRAECTLFRFARNVNISNNGGGDIIFFLISLSPCDTDLFVSATEETDSNADRYRESDRSSNLSDVKADIRAGSSVSNAESVTALDSEGEGSTRGVNALALAGPVPNPLGYRYSADYTEPSFPPKNNVSTMW